MLDVQVALKLLLDAVRPLDAIEVALADALGKTLAETAVADRDSPPTDRSAMDGFAVRAADGLAAGRSLVVRGEVRAGQDPGTISVGAGEAVRIFTGAVIPEGADAVVMVEATAEDHASRTLTVNERTEPGQHIRRRGEAVREGATVVAAGVIVGPAEVAALAAVGRTRVRVVRAPRVAVISTGDEGVEADRVPAPHQVRNSNAAMLLAQLAERRVAARYLGIAGDEPDALAAVIEDGLRADVLVLTGGVSVGEYDLVGAALLRAGCTVLFHTVAMRPGKPILAAQRGSCLVMGLPGNPVSAFTGFHVFVAPALRKLMGEPRPVTGTVRAALLSPLHGRPGRLTYHLAQLRWNDGRPVVAPVPSSSSGDVLSLVAANAFIVVPGEARAISAGDEVDVLPWGTGPLVDSIASGE
jgi:molybdopterin molybdotransferase